MKNLRIADLTWDALFNLRNTQIQTLQGGITPPAISYSVGYDIAHQAGYSIGVTPGRSTHAVSAGVGAGSGAAAAAAVSVNGLPAQTVTFATASVVVS